MRRWFGLGVIVAILAAATHTDASGAVPRTGGAVGECSQATAQALARQYKLGDQTYNYPVGQVLCGPFTGPGSNAVAFSFHYYGCIATSGFAVFRFTGGDWQLVLKNADPFISLSRAGSEIREKVSVFRNGDPRCVPSGGTRERLWHWDGQRLVASAWRRLTPPTGSSSATLARIYSPSKNLACEMADHGPGGSYVTCQSYHAQHWVSMGLNGRLKICARGPRCVGNFGEGPHFNLLAYGKQLTVGRFRCFSLMSGMKCVVISSGHGFLIDKVGVRRVGP